MLLKYASLTALACSTVQANSNEGLTIENNADDNHFKAVDEYYKDAISRAMRGRSSTRAVAGQPIVAHGTVANMLNINHSGNQLITPQRAQDSSNPKTRFGLQFQIPAINNYGCWCYGGDHWPGALDNSGFGPVMDAYDETCKAHHMGFDCIVKDAAAEGKVCHPTDTIYDLMVSPQPNGSYVLECHDNIADDWCKRRVCMVDLRFIARSYKLQKDGVFPNYPAYGHPGFHWNLGSFDTLATCVPPGIRPRPIDQQCCGDYPYRLWLDVNNRQGYKCCEVEDQNIIDLYGFYLKVGKIFDEDDEECCIDGGVKPIGTC